ncbi:MAG: tetratricopeptide repeat protein [Blastochloris sp.]|nr:tetratricopeptide repeat protein [Blastochloris sp.]
MKCFNASVFVVWCLFSALVFAPLQQAEAQDTAAALMNKGLDAVNNGNFEEASKVFQDLLTKFPQDFNAPNARYLLGISYYSLGNFTEAVKYLADSKGFLKETLPIAAFHLGAAHYFLGDPDKAIPALENAAKSGNEEIVPFALLYLGRANMDKGNKLLATDKTKAGTFFDAGVAKLNELITKYPENPNVIDAIMTKASLNAAARRFDAAATTLQELKSRPDASEMGEDADYLLGFVYSQQAQSLLADLNNAEAEKAIQNARETYQRLQKSENLAIANDASYQLANLSFADKNYAEALRQFRALRSNTELIESQNKRIADIKAKFTEAGGNKERLAALTRAKDRENAKLKALEENTDTSVDSLIRIGDCYRQLKQYDEARIVYRHAAQFAKDDKAKDLNLQIIVSLALQGLGQKADAAFAEFKAKFPKDPDAEGVPFFIARAMIQQGNFDEAIKKLNQVIKDSPNSKFAALSVQELARAYLGQKKPEEALKLIEDFAANIKKGGVKLPPDVLEDAERFRAYTLFQLGKKEEAIAAMRSLANTATNEALKQEALYQVGNMLNSSGRERKRSKPCRNS